MSKFNNFRNLSLMLLTATVMFNACKDDEVPPVNKPIDQNEEELITTVKLRFVNEKNASDVRTFIFSDPDGDGGKNPTVFDTITLDSNSVYKLDIAFLDESNPADIDDITAEILKEADEHLVCIVASDGSATLQILDEDKNKLPLGLQYRVTTTRAASGKTFTLTLKHQPDVKNGDCEPGETDVEVAFPFRVK